ncbi:MAG TPA: choice-of-anchor tandem repeat GloVer-containing protein [Candidatus Sulfotelmatobacter sp.]|nr:choice-of-anchor tandem repeat GloVer-containing protein [Candidatus Sulfotelmatobacter sp.]
MRLLGTPKSACVALCVILGMAIASPGQTFTSLVSFNGTDGANPGLGSLIQGTDGNFYGTTINGGIDNAGTIFKISSTGTLTTLYSFCEHLNCSDGQYPYGVLVQANDGNFYGTTYQGGGHNFGEVYKITPSGTFTTLYSFCAQTSCTDGQSPSAGLVQGTDGNLYGTTTNTFFKMTTRGALTTLYTFCSQANCADGSDPQGALVQSTNGAFYGTTMSGGANSCGTVFEITTAGKLTTLHTFNNTDGCMPAAALVLAANGNFYGTTSVGGTNNSGTLFKITSAGVLTTLYNFCTQTNCTDGGSPHDALVQGTDGNFYGTTAAGANDNGVVFEFTSGSRMKNLHIFSGTDGDMPYGGLLQGTDGSFYGTTLNGGTSNLGSVFNVTNGLGAFVRTTTTSGKVGAAVTILGTDLTGATAVTFGGISSTFTVVSASEITTTVPAGAITGTVNVALPAGTLMSNVTYRVTPQLLSFSPSSGAVGTTVTITGVSLTKTTKVTFGGVAAKTYTVNSDTQVTATVPTGAKTGKIQITTTGGTATSTTNFTVTAP